MLQIKDCLTLLCHRRPDRTLYLAGAWLPLCSRCTGLYAGFLLSIAWQWFSGGRRRTLLPPRPALEISAVLGILGILEIFLPGWGIARDGNPARLAAGLLTGTSLALFMLPVFNRFFYQPVSRPEKTLRPASYAFPFLFSAVLFLLSSWEHPAAYRLLSATSLLGLLLVYLLINLMLASMLLDRPKTDTAGRRRQVFLRLLAALLFLGLEILFLRFNPLRLSAG